MVAKNNSNKALIEELKKYNKDLDKHVPGINTDFLENESIFNQDPNKKDYLTLFAENILDLRTEIALMRKNLSVDIEGMISRVVTKQQNEFEERMNDFFVKSVIETKKNWEKHINEFALEMSSMKKVSNKIKLQNETIEKNLKDLNQGLILVATKLEYLNESSKDREHIHKIDEIQSLVANLSSQISEGSAAKKTLAVLSEDVDKLKLQSNEPQLIEKKEEVKVEKKTENEFMEQRVPTQGDKDYVPKINRILEIDKKIQKLDALR